MNKRCVNLFSGSYPGSANHTTRSELSLTNLSSNIQSKKIRTCRTPFGLCKWETKKLFLGTMRPSLYFNWDARSFVGHKYCALTLFSLHHCNSYVPQRLQCRCRVVPFWKVYVSASGSNLLRLVAVVPFDIQRICHSMPRSSVLCRCELGTQVCNTCSTERERPQLLILICVVILTSSEKTYMLVGCL